MNLPPLVQLKLDEAAPVAGAPGEGDACDIENLKQYGHLLSLLREGLRPRDIKDPEDKKEVVETMKAVQQSCGDTWEKLRLYQLQMIQKRNPMSFGDREQFLLDALKKKFPYSKLEERADEIIRRFEEDFAKFAAEEEAKDEDKQQEVIRRLSSRDYGAPVSGENVAGWFSHDYNVVDLLYNKPVLSWDELRNKKDGTVLRVQMRNADGTEATGRNAAVRDLDPVKKPTYMMENNRSERQWSDRARQYMDTVLLAAVGGTSKLLVLERDMYIPAGTWLSRGRAGYAMAT